MYNEYQRGNGIGEPRSNSVKVRSAFALIHRHKSILPAARYRLNNNELDALASVGKGKTTLNSKPDKVTRKHIIIFPKTTQRQYKRVIRVKASSLMPV